MMKERRAGLRFLGLCLTFMVAEVKPTVLKHEFFLVSNQKLNWTEAQTFCRSHYQDLGSILDSNTNQLVKDMASDKDAFWIGLFSKDRTWRWSLLDPGLEETYRNWDKRHYSQDEKDQNCVTMNRDGFWRADQCLRTEKAFVCSHNSHKRPYVLVNQRRSWFSAQSFCRRNHRDLVSVSSDEENQALLSLIKDQEQDPGHIWIGLHRPQWNWSDGSVYRFSHWRRPQDNLRQNQSVCVTMRDGEWRGRECGKRLDFLCERTSEVGLPPDNGSGSAPIPSPGSSGGFQTSVRMRMKIRTQADLNDPAVVLAVTQQLKALHPDARVSLMALKAEPHEKERDSCEMELKPTLN